MNINNFVSANVNTCNTQNQPNFKALPVAKYHVKGDVVKIYELEKKDLPFVQKFLKNIQGYFKDKGIDDYSRQEVMEESFGATDKILSSKKSLVDKAKIYVAVAKDNLCGVIIGNVPKGSKKGTVHYSSRKNHGNRETELDWLATWNPKKGTKVSGVGKVITSEYFKSLKKDGFKNVFVRSEVPENSYAQDFYTRMGFKAKWGKRESISKKANNTYLIGNYDTPGEDIVPMLASKSDIKKTVDGISKDCNREKMSGKSVNLQDVIK